jgi:hypothetical protein
MSICRRSATALLVILAAGASPALAQSPVPPLRVLGFGDFNYLATERDVPAGFRTGQLAVHGIAGLTPRLTFFGEATATPLDRGFAVEVERLILRHDFGDSFKLSAGRYHTPISYWNTAYHHGTWLHTSVARPEMIRFGGVLLPVHFVGVLAEGSFPRIALGPGYAVGYGNGRHANVARPGDAGDVDGHRAVLASVHLRPPRFFGLQAGAAVYVDRIATSPGFDLDERILSAHLSRESAGPELLAEYTHVRHSQPQLGAESVANGYYLQVAHRIASPGADFKPYLRLERVDPSADPLLDSVSGLDYRGAILGVRHDFAPMAALKAEYRRERFQLADWSNSLHLQVSFVLGMAGGHEHDHHAGHPAGAASPRSRR